MKALPRKTRHCGRVLKGGEGSITGDDVLRCAHCGNEYTHHGKVHVFYRDDEDAREGQHIVVGDGKFVLDRSMKGNPSRRRDGVAIDLRCECCLGMTVLTIRQHKGWTILETWPGKKASMEAGTW